MKNPKINLIDKYKTRGPVIPTVIYEKLTTFILRAIRRSETGFVPLDELIEDPELSLLELGGEVTWFLLKVKADLEGRGIIRIRFDAKRRQLISINSKVKNGFLPFHEFKTLLQSYSIRMDE